MKWDAFIYFSILAFIPNYFYKGRTFEKTSWMHTLGLSSLFLLSIILLWTAFQSFTLVVSQVTISLFALSTLAWFLWPIIIRHIGRYPGKYIAHEPMRFLARFDPKITVFKYLEVILQQVGMAYLLFVVLSNFMYPIIIVYFTLIITLLHAANFFVMPPKWALFYLLLSIPMALIFLFVIRNGYLFITISLHLWFYVIHNSYYWLKESRHPRLDRGSK